MINEYSVSDLWQKHGPVTTDEAGELHPFKGGHWLLHEPVKCHKCLLRYPLASCLALVADDGTPPPRCNITARVANEVADGLANGVGQRGNLQSHVPDISSHPGFNYHCYMCIGALHSRQKGMEEDPTFYMDKMTGGLRPAWSAFRAITKHEGKSRRVLVIRNACEAAVRRAKQRGGTVYTVDIDRVFNLVMQDPRLGASGDFVIHLGGDILICYTCPHCNKAFVNMEEWVRCAKESHRHLPGNTFTGDGHWRCPISGCCGRWDRGDRHWAKRVVIYPKPRLAENGGLVTPSGQELERIYDSEEWIPATWNTEEGIEMVHLGDLTQEQCNELTLFKSASLLETITLTDGTVLDAEGLMQVETHRILAAISRSNSDASTKLMAYVPTRQYRRATQHEFYEHNAFPYCESPVLSQSKFAGWLRAADATGIHELDSEGRTALLDGLLCFLNLDHADGNPTDRPLGSKRNATHRRWETLKDRQDKKFAVMDRQYQEDRTA